MSNFKIGEPVQAVENGETIEGIVVDILNGSDGLIRVDFKLFQNDVGYFGPDELRSLDKGMVLLIFLGRSVEGILADASRTWPDVSEVIFICRDQEQLTAPNGFPVVSVSQFQPEQAHSYLVVANGATSQLLPTVKKLVCGGVRFQAYDLQREGPPVQLW